MIFKNTLYILFILSTLNIYAQRTLSIVEYRSMQGRFLPSEGDYITNSELAKFEGTWQWANASDTFTIILRKSLKAPINMQGTRFHDLIFGRHQMIKNGVIRESTLLSDSSIWFGTTWKKPHRLEFSFNDITKDKWGEATLELLEPGTRVRIGSQARFQLAMGEVITINGMLNGKPYQKGFTVPTDVIMTKIE